MMHMWYWFGNNLGNFLLPGYNVVTTTSFFCTCLGLFALAILYEGTKVIQIKLQHSNVILAQKQSQRTLENSCLLSKISSRFIGTHVSLQCIHWSAWTFQVFHWTLRTSLGYILMLAVMTYNVYISIAIVLGGCIGYWIFGPKFVEYNIKQYYEKQRLLDCDKECPGHITNHQRHDSMVSIVAEELVTEATVEVHMPKDP
ncbi:protein SLC31A2 isoform X1 [Xylocopa sonorina]|uniref:protein SLC31A2 isoform X1 n=2 Tax=Xylocopa sonorina TaxID=1818115 RepID=UPI00403AE982